MRPQVCVFDPVRLFPCCLPHFCLQVFCLQVSMETGAREVSMTFLFPASLHTRACTQAISSRDAFVSRTDIKVSCSNATMQCTLLELARSHVMPCHNNALRAAARPALTGTGWPRWRRWCWSEWWCCSVVTGGLGMLSGGSEIHPRIQNSSIHPSIHPSIRP